MKKNKLTALQIVNKEIPLIETFFPFNDESNKGLTFITPEYRQGTVNLNSVESIENGLQNARVYSAKTRDYYNKPLEFDYLLKENFRLAEVPSLTDKQSIAISLYILAGHTKKKTGKIMGISSQAVSDHLVAGIKKVRKYLTKG